MGFLDKLFHSPQAAPPATGFELARSLARASNPRQVVLVRPDSSTLCLACPASGTLPAELVARAEAILPASTPRNLAVLTATAFAPQGPVAEVGSPDWNLVAETIPFFGLLNGLAYRGHCVWIFDGDTADIAAGCREADVLIIDSELLPRLPAATLDLARNSMRGYTILVHDRATFQLHALIPPQPLAEVLEQARTHTVHEGKPRIVFVQPDQTYLLLPCLPANSLSPSQLAQVHRIVPPGKPRAIAVIASTKLIPDPAEAAKSPEIARLRAAGKAIPFFGLLLNLASLGNPTWIFEGQPEALEAGCRQADLLFIESALANRFTTTQIDAAAKVMRSANIVVYHRETRQMAFLHSVSGSQDKIEFRDA